MTSAQSKGHDGHRDQSHEKDHDGPKPRVVRGNGIDDIRVGSEDRRQEQRVDGLGHRAEVGRTDGGALSELPQDDGKGVGDDSPQQREHQYLAHRRIRPTRMDGDVFAYAR